MSLRFLLCFALPVFLSGLIHQSAAHQSTPEPLWEMVADSSNDTPQFLLNRNELEKVFFEASVSSGCVIELPLPTGELAAFYIYDSQVMPQELAEQFPEIKSYAGRSTLDEQTAVKIDFCPGGLRAEIFAPTETFYIFCPPDGNGAYISVSKKTLQRGNEFQCLSSLSGPKETSPKLAALGAQRGGRELRTYRIAVAASGEFTQANGGTTAGAMAAIVSTINRVNGIYEKELGIRLQLVPNNNKLIFTNPNSDPYSANAANATTLLENQTAVDLIIGSSNYDIGHLFNTAQYGLAYTGVVCRENWKARGCIGTATPGGNLFFADYAAHEIAHQFGASHTFNSLDGNCAGSRSPNSAFEPGSGSTLMAYAGFCNNDNLQSSHNAYFHSGSYDEILQFVTSGTGAACAQVISTGNNPPVVDAPSHFAIPRGTPFQLVASGYDPDGDAVTYCWEQRDLGPPQSIYEPDNGQSPLFRSFEPSPNPSRTFPRLQDILNNQLSRGERLPQVSRSMRFRVTARDNRGGISTADTQITVSDSGPFRVTSHGSGGTFFGPQTINWDVAGTGSAPVNASHVNILLSTNGGLNFNLVLAANTPNDGSERVLFPNTEIQNARLRIEAVGNIFFTITPGSFSIRPYFSVTDFNRDGKVDLLWQSSRGQLSAWLLDGTNILQGASLRNGVSVPRQWSLVGLYDFNSDANVDLLWKHVDGTTLVWFMNGVDFVSAKTLRDGLRMPPVWTVVCVSDFDGDSEPDILWQHDNRKLAVWKMSGSDLVQGISLRNGLPAGAGWRAVAMSDMNADGANDIIFRNTDGRMAVWIMDGFEFVRSEALDAPRLNADWQLSALADLDGNGQNDFIWTHINGAIRVWFMSGRGFFQTGTFRNGSVPPQWKLVGPK